MENRFLNCCHDSLLIGIRSECDRFSCQEGKHDPVFDLYYHKGNNEYFYCVNRNQLGQYWKCVVEDGDAYCPSTCDKCNICNEMTEIFSELQDSYFSIQELVLQIIKKTFHINLFCGVYLIV